MRNTLRMAELCNSFPELRGVAGTRPWDAESFAAGATRLTGKGARQAAAFVLALWNGLQPADGGWWNEGGLNVGRFDPIVALHWWDAEHRTAFLVWCQSPWWP